MKKEIKNKNSETRKIVFLTLGLCFILLNLTIVSADYSQWDSSVYEDELLGWYRFDNVTSIGDDETTALDYSGNNNNGTYQIGAGINLLGLVGAGYSGGILGGADRVSVSGIEDIFFDDFTVTGWFNSRLWNSDTVTTDNLIGNQNGISGSNIGWKLLDNDANETGLVVQANNGSNFNNIATPNNFTEDTWFYFAITYNGTRVHFYINETLQGTSSTIPDGLNNSNPFEIGNAQSSTSRAFNGTMDEVMIFNRTLDITNITNIYLQQRDNCLFPYNNMTITENSTFCFGGQYNRTSDFERYFNDNETIQYNISLLSLTNALIYFDNFSVSSSTNLADNDGNINLILPTNNISFILNDFNLTEGITRENSPINITSITTSINSKTYSISSLINEDIIVPVNLNVLNSFSCSDIGSITITPKNRSGYSPTYSCSNNLITLNSNLSYSTTSNIILVNFNNAGLNTFCSNVTSGMPDFFSSVVIIFVIIAIGVIVLILLILPKVINGEDFNTDLIEDIFEQFPIGVVLSLIAGLTILVWAIIIIMGVLCS